MKVYAINGSPRKKGNTITLLQKALDGVKESIKDQEIETKIINLYDLNYTGCKSCFACKRIGAKSYGKCVAKDNLKEVLEKLLFPYHTYDKELSVITPKRMPTAFIYTMNSPEEAIEQMGYKTAFANTEWLIEHMFTKPEVMYSCNTYQFDDYSKYESSFFSAEQKIAHRETQFPIDCEKAFELGANLIK